MNNLEVLKGILVQEINNLPEDKLREVLDFVNSLQDPEAEGEVIETETQLEPAQDPILKFIGGVAHGSLAKDVDRELYGEER